MKLRSKGKLNSYLSDMDEQANKVFLPAVKGITKQENVIEELKAENAMFWIE